MLSQSNVRHVKAGVSIEELAGDIARRGLLVGLIELPVEEKVADGGESAVAADGATVEDAEAVDDEEAAFEPHAIAAE